MESKIVSDQFIGMEDEAFERTCRDYALLEPIVAGYLEGNELKTARERARMELGCSERTLRRKLRRLKQRGIAALARHFRRDKGRARKITGEIVTKLCELIRENPYRSVPKALSLLRLDEAYRERVNAITPAGVYRSLKHSRIELKKMRNFTPQTVKRSFTADFANQLWQADSRMGITLPDPENPRRRKLTKLFVWLDDYSRMLLFGRYYFDETLPHLEASFRQAILRHGIPRRLYCDNGSAYKAKHFTMVCDNLGVYKIHHPPYQAWCKGKVESFNKTAKVDFQSEAARADIKTLDELNSAFEAWGEMAYNRRIHGETGEKPRDRYSESIRKNPPRQIESAEDFERLFLWKEERVVDKFGLLSFEGNLYRADGFAIGDRVLIRFNPFDLSSVELWRSEIIFVGIAKADKLAQPRVKSMPQEHKNERGPQISKSAQRYFAKLREDLTQERAAGADSMQAFLKLKEKHHGA